MYIVCYDIADGRRLYKVAKLLSDYGIRVQKSVFYCNVSETKLQRMLNWLNMIIDVEEDSILIQPLCENCEKKTVFIGYEANALSMIMATYQIL